MATSNAPSKTTHPQDNAHSHGVVYLSPADETANVTTHAIGFLLSLVVGVGLWHQTRSLPAGLRYACLAFSVTLALVYLASTLSHAVPAPKLRERMRAWDQGTIYLLIVEAK